MACALALALAFALAFALGVLAFALAFALAWPSITIDHYDHYITHLKSWARFGFNIYIALIISS